MNKGQMYINIANDELKNPENRLFKAIIDDDFVRFCHALESGSDPTKTDSSNQSAFERVLSTKGKSCFVKECFNWDCNPYNINGKPKKLPIHCAVESQDPLILAILLNNPGIDVNRKYEEQTPLNILIDQFTLNLKDAAIDDVVECIQKLLDYGASPNIRSKNNLRPIKRVFDLDGFKEAQMKIVELFSKKDDLELNNMARKEFKKYPGLKLPSMQLTNKSPMTLRQLEPLFSNNYDENKEIEILTELQKYFLQSTQADSIDEKKVAYTKLINKSIELGYNKAFNALHQIERDLTIDEIRTSVETALRVCNIYAFKQLILYNDFKSGDIRDLLMQCLKTKTVRWDKSSLLEKCFDVLLSLDECKINLCDKEGLSLLYHADLHDSEAKVPNASKKLLAKGAYIAIKNPTKLSLGKRALQNVSCKLLEQYFDTCITTNVHDFRAENFEILIDFKNLINLSTHKTQPTATSNFQANTSAASRVSWFHMGKMFGRADGNDELKLVTTHSTAKVTNIKCTTAPKEPPPTPITQDKESGTDQNIQVSNEKSLIFSEKLKQEIDSIAFFTESPKYKPLILHPVIRSFIYIKWHRISKMFNLHVWFYAVFYLSMLFYTILIFVTNDFNFLRLIFFSVTLIFSILLSIREFFQIYIAQKNCKLLEGLKIYFWSIINLMELLLIGFSFGFLFSSNANMAIINLFLMSWELGLLLASYPRLNISTLMQMWKTVFVTFLKCFLVFAVFLVNFSMAFFISSCTKENSSLHTKTQNENLTSYLCKSAHENSSLYTCEKAASKHDRSKFPQNQIFEFNKFTNFWPAVLKAIVMLTGEFDASSLQLDDFVFSLVFVLFVIMVTMVLSNLLYGLAVSDTQAIQAKAEFNGLENRVKLLQRYVKIIDSVENSFIQDFLETHFNWNEHFSTCTGITILPNQANKVIFKGEDPPKTHSIPLDCEIVRLVFAVIERRKVDETDKRRSQEAAKRQEYFKNDLEKKLALIQNRLKETKKWRKDAEEELTLIKAEINKNTQMLNEVLNYCKVVHKNSDYSGL